MYSNFVLLRPYLTIEGARRGGDGGANVEPNGGCYEPHADHPGRQPGRPGSAPVYHVSSFTPLGEAFTSLAGLLTCCQLSFESIQHSLYINRTITHINDESIQ